MDIVLEVMRVDAPVAEHKGKWRQGDIVGVREVGKLWHDQDWPQDPALVAPALLTCGVPRKAFVVIRGLPNVGIERVRRALTEAYTVAEGDTDYSRTLGKREWFVEHAALPALAQAKINLTPHVLDVTWQEVRNSYVRGRRRGRYLGNSDV